MFLKPKGTKDHGVRTVDGCQIQIVETIWPDNSSSFEVWYDDDVDLSIGSCFTTMPSDKQIERLLRDFLYLN